MKELISTNAIYYLALGDKGAIPMVELSLMLAVTEFVPDGKGNAVKKHKPETVTFGTQPKAMRRLAANLQQLANECEALAGKVAAAPPPAESGELRAESPAEEPEPPDGKVVQMPGTRPAPLAVVETLPDLKDLTRAQYQKLKESGELPKLYPAATGDYARDTGLN